MANVPTKNPLSRLVVKLLSRFRRRMTVSVDELKHDSMVVKKAIGQQQLVTGNTLEIWDGEGILWFRLHVHKLDNCSANIHIDVYTVPKE